MRAPVSWLAEHVDLPQGITARELADAVIRTGMEVESVDVGAEGLSGPIVVGRVLAFADERQKNGKTIRWCQVDVGEDGLITKVTPMQDLRQWENGGYFLFRPEIFDYLNEGDDVLWRGLW